MQGTPPPLILTNHSVKVRGGREREREIEREGEKERDANESERMREREFAHPRASWE